MSQQQRVQCFGRKKNAVAVCMAQSGKVINFRINGMPIDQIQPEILRVKVYEPLLLLGKGNGVSGKWGAMDFKIRCNGGGYTSQIYAIRQAVARAIIAYNQKYVDEATKKEMKDTLTAYDKTLIVSDPRRVEPKKFGGRGARARFQKSYR